MNLKIFLKNIHLLNFLLIVFIGISVQYLFLPSHTVQPLNLLPPAGQSPEDGEEIDTEAEIPSPAEYTVLSDQNLFHPERTIPIEKKAEQPLPKPDFVLYGTLISDTVALAYIEDMKAPRSSPGRGKRQTAMKKGDSLSGFILREIEPDKIVMARGEEKIIIQVNDPAHPRERAAAVTPAAAPDKPQQAAGQQKPGQRATPRSSATQKPAITTPSPAPPAGTSPPAAHQGGWGSRFRREAAPGGTQ